jgi:hypothetical protein
MDDLEVWRRALGRHYRLQGARTIRHEYRQNTCGPSSYAAVELRFAPSRELTFVRTAEWPPQVSPSEAAALDATIEAGVRDALQPRNGLPYAATGVSVECVHVGWDEVGSSAVSFYAAAWHATTELRDAAAWELVATS